MSNFIKLSVFCLFLSSSLFAQKFISSGGGNYNPAPQQNCLSAADYTRMHSDINHSVDSLRNAGVLPQYNTEATIQFDWPLKAAAGLNWNSFYAISGFVDQNASSAIEDFACGQRTYDGHKGVDIYTWPFSWYLKDNDLAQVVTAAAGIIVQKYDGNVDDNCSWTQGQNWNAVYVQHSDGSIAWYGHMKKNSLTSKNVGDNVSKGEYLGVVASAGRSSGPHLHFEIYDSASVNIDPYAGTCNSKTTSSWWASQESYWNPTINALLTHNKTPQMGCPSANEDPHFSDQFFPGDTLTVAVYYRDAITGDSTVFKIKRPDNSVWHTWTHLTGATYSSSWWYWSAVLPEIGPFGTWTFEAEYRGNTIIHNFQYGTPIGINETISEKGKMNIYPNPFKDQTTIEFINRVSGNVSLELYNMLGEKQETLFEGFVNKGAKQKVAFAKNDQAEGIYFVLLRQNGKIISRKKVLVY